MKRGDVFLWVLRSTGRWAEQGEELWSSTDKCYVPADGVNLVLDVRGGNVTWWCHRGTYTTRVEDNVSLGKSGASRWLVVKPII